MEKLLVHVTKRTSHKKHTMLKKKKPSTKSTYYMIQYLCSVQKGQWENS